MTGILGVHGVRNYDPAASDEARAEIWKRNLRRGFGAGPAPELDLTVAYYAPALHLGTGQGAEDAEHLTTEEREAVWEWLVASGIPESTAQGEATRPLRQGLEWFARRFDLDQGVVSRAVARIFPEVTTYLSPTHADRREQARGIVGEAIDRHTPRIVLAHSLGSVVTYEALWQDPSREIDLLVTLGSPLAMPSVVYDRLEPSPRDQPARKPPGVRRWVDVSDPGDAIAILRPMSNYFDGIDQLLEPTVAGGVKFHFVSEYLSCPAVAALVGAELARR